MVEVQRTEDKAAAPLQQDQEGALQKLSSEAQSSADCKYSPPSGVPGKFPGDILNGTAYRGALPNLAEVTKLLEYEQGDDARKILDGMPFPERLQALHDIKDLNDAEKLPKDSMAKLDIYSTSENGQYSVHVRNPVAEFLNRDIYGTSINLDVSSPDVGKQSSSSYSTLGKYIPWPKHH